MGSIVQPKLTRSQLVELLANAHAAAEAEADRVSVRTDALLGLLALGNVVVEARMCVDSLSQIFDGDKKSAEMVVMRSPHGACSGRLELVLGPEEFAKLKEKRFYRVQLVPCAEG